MNRRAARGAPGPADTADERSARRLALVDWADAHALGALWSAEDARWASAQARADLAQGRATDFRRARAAHGVQRLGERDERWLAWLERPLWPWRWPLGTLLVALLAGLLLDRLGGQQLNLLLLPLWPVLLLQLASTLLMPLWMGARRGRPSGVERLLRALAGRGLADRQAAALAHWWAASAPLQAARAALLGHLASLGLSLGLVAGLYGRALGQEFVIGWQSTFLRAEQVQALADRLLAPAAWLLGQPVPAVDALRHGALQAPSQPAGEWLHLLALTVLLVALPRALLAAWAALRVAWLGAHLPLTAGATDLHLCLLDPDGRLGTGLLAAAGERLSSPEGDRLFVHLRSAPVPELRAWPAWLHRLGTWGRSSPAVDALPAETLHLQADALPPAAPGWPAQRAQLRALDRHWPPSRQRAWQRLRAAWEQGVADRERRARQRMAEALASLLQLRPALPEGADAQQVLARALQAPLQALAADLAALYAEEGAGGREPGECDDSDDSDDSDESVDASAAAGAQAWTALGAGLPLQVHKPLSLRRSAAGGAAGGAAAGVGVDLALGGLTLGAGAALGAALGAASGALAAAGLAKGWNRSHGVAEAHLTLQPQDAAPALAACVMRPWAQRLGLAPAPARWRELAAAQPWAEAWARAARAESFLAPLDALCEGCLDEQAPAMPAAPAAPGAPDAGAPA